MLRSRLPVLWLALLAPAAPLAAQQQTASPDAVPAASPASPETTAPAPAEWRIDPAHSEVTFRIRHLVTRVQGTFREWSGMVTGSPENWGEGGVEVTIRTASIDTRNERRDTHLRSADFFDAERHPLITFRSRSVEVDGERLRIAGDLTMRGVTRPVTLEGLVVGHTGAGTDRERIGFEARATINRMDFGVSWNRAAEGGGVVLGDEVDVDISVAAVRAGPSTP